MNFKEFFNASNYFLLFLIVLTGFNVLLNVNITNNRIAVQKTDEVLILNQEKELFGGLYWLVWYQNSIWKLTDKDNFYYTGQGYKLEAEFLPFNFDSQDEKNSFYLNTGIVGEIKPTKRIAKTNNCNFFCSFLQWTQDLRYKFRLKQINLACNKYFKILKKLTPQVECQDVAALSTGLTMGGTKDFKLETRNNFRKMGLMHLVAISGLQVVLVISFVEWVLLNLRISKTYRIIIFILFLLLLLMLAGPAPPILRSSLSVLLSIFSLKLFGRKLSGLRVLAYTAIILLWISPAYIFSFSFLMSFLASLGLRLMKFKQVFQNFILVSLSDIFNQSIAALLFVLPVVVNLSGFVSISSLFTNLVILPLIPIITVLNFASILPFIGDYLYFIALFLQSHLLVFIEDFSSYSVLLKFKPFSNLEIAIYYLILIFLVEIVRRTADKYFERKIYHNTTNFTK
jgi:ComEC/Rec2-related protein